LQTKTATRSSLGTCGKTKRQETENATGLFPTCLPAAADGVNALSTEAEAGNAGRSEIPERIGRPAAIRGSNDQFHLPTSVSLLG